MITMAAVVEEAKLLDSGLLAALFEIVGQWSGGREAGLVDRDGYITVMAGTPVTRSMTAMISIIVTAVIWL